MSQVIKYNGNYKTPFFTIYRGGVKEKSTYSAFEHRNISFIVGDDQYNRYDWDHDDTFTDGYYFSVKDIDKALEFFGFDKNNEREQYKEVDLNLCFTNNDTFILFKKNANPKPITKVFSKRTKTFREFVRFDDVFGFGTVSKELKFWKFKSPNDYIVCNICSIPLLRNLIPELIFDKDHDKYYETFGHNYSNKERYDILYDLGIIDLNSSWDFSQEFKNDIIKRREIARQEQLKREAELEERKMTPGYCCQCGAEHANYTYDPFEQEMNGITRYMYLCNDCFNELCMEI